MEKAEAFHKQCLSLWSTLNESNTQLKERLHHIRKTYPSISEDLDELEKIKLQNNSISVINNRLKVIKHHIPQPTGVYLKMIIGPISLSLPTRDAKFAYKNSYENLKLFNSIFTICLSIILVFVNIK